MKEQLNLSELSEQELKESYTFDDLVTMVSNLQVENQTLYTQLMETQKDFLNATVKDAQMQKQRVESLAAEIKFYKEKADGYKKQLDEKSMMEQKIDLLVRMVGRIGAHTTSLLSKNGVSSATIKEIEDNFISIVDEYDEMCKKG